MFKWQPQKIAYMKDASEFCGFNNVLAAKMSPYLSGTASVCDAGCGLGYLSLALSGLCRKVTAVDIEPLALSVLMENAENRGINNIEIIEGDIAGLKPEAPFDVMVFAFFGSTPEVLRTAKKFCRGKVFLFRKNWNSHRFTIARKPLEFITLGCVRSSLEALCVPYTAETFSLQMGQPFRSLADAAEFFRIYSRDDDPSGISENDVAGKLVEIDAGDFKYFLPSEKNVGMIVVDASDIPEVLPREVQP